MSLQDSSRPSVAHVTDAMNGTALALECTHPPEYNLFGNIVPSDYADYTSEDGYSNTIELYDAIPKYVSSTRRMGVLRENGIYLKTLRREFQYGTEKHKRWYKVEITPARLSDKQGNEKEYYPNQRVELVEEALRKIACDQLSAVYLDGFAGVRFTMYQLRKELASRGHTMNYPALIEALKIGHSAGMKLTLNDGGEINAPIFPVLALTKRHEWEEHGRNTRCFVQFHPLVTRSIDEITYRQFHYATGMQLKKPLSRWFFKRLSHVYRQASTKNNYRISHSTLVRDSGLVNATRMDDQIRDVCEALDELQGVNIGERRKARKKKVPYERPGRGGVWIVMHFALEHRTGPRGKIEEVIYTIQPSPIFAGLQVAANKRDSLIQQRANQQDFLRRGKV
jgi:hypothetical protein